MLKYWDELAGCRRIPSKLRWRILLSESAGLKLKDPVPTDNTSDILTSQRTEICARRLSGMNLIQICRQTVPEYWLLGVRTLERLIPA